MGTFCLIFLFGWCNSGFRVACVRNCIRKIECMFEEGIVSPDTCQIGFETTYLSVVEYLIEEQDVVPSNDAILYNINALNTDIVEYILNLKGFVILFDKNLMNAVAKLTEQKIENKKQYDSFKKKTSKKSMKLRKTFVKNIEMLDLLTVYISSKQYKYYERHLYYIAVAATIPRRAGAPRIEPFLGNLQGSRDVPDSRFFNLLEQPQIKNILTNCLERGAF